MNKTIFGLDKSMSIAVLSAIAMLFIFVSGQSSIGGLFSFLMMVVKSVVFVLVPLSIYFLERNEYELKRIAGIYVSYFLVHLFIVIICSVLSSGGVLSFFLNLVLDFVNLTILLSSLFIFIEQILEYSEIKNKVYNNTIMRIVYLIANFVSYPFFKFVTKNIENK